MIHQEIVENFCQKYPKLAFDALTWEPKQPPALELNLWIKKLNIEKVELLYVYGLDDGSCYLALKPWLLENPKRRLVFLVDDVGYVAWALEKMSSFLEDERVYLAIDFSIDELAERFPVDQVEVVALPKKANKTFRVLKIALLQKTSIERSLYLERLYGHHIFNHFIHNLPRVEESFYANRLKDSFKDVPAIICGAGPSLENDLPILKKLDSRAIVIAGGSAIGALTVKGITPHFGMAVDPNDEEFKRFKDSFYFEGPFLFSTRVCPKVFSTLNGPYGYLRSGVGNVFELWLEEELKLEEPLLGHELTQNAIAVTPLAVAFAQLLGCNPIILTGVDLAYTNGKRYASGVDFVESIKKLKSEKNATNQILKRKDKQNNPIITAVRWEMERKSLAAFAKKHPKTKWINATQGGLNIERFQNLSLEAAASDFIQQPNLTERIQNEIQKHPMPPCQHLLDTLKNSLSRVVENLRILTGERPGSEALAECDLLEEIATSIFLSELPKLCRQYFQTENIDPQKKWSLFLEIARNYLRGCNI